jgi:hypothetical protein
LSFAKLWGISQINEQRLARNEDSTTTLREVAVVLRSDEWSKFDPVFPANKLTCAVIQKQIKQNISWLKQ